MKTRFLSILSTFALVPAALAQNFSIDWHTIEPGGTAQGGTFDLACVIGQPDAGPAMSGGTFELLGGFLSGSGPRPCYANCDGGTVPPVANVADFICFQNQFAAGTAYANCDQSTTPPVLNVADFICFLNAFAAGCP